MKFEIIKLSNVKEDKNEAYNEYLYKISEKSGFDIYPTPELIERNKEQFRVFFEKYPYIDKLIAKLAEGNYIINSSIYPSKDREYNRRVNKLRKCDKRNVKSIYNYFIKDNIDIIDYERFILSLIYYLNQDNMRSKVFDENLEAEILEYFREKGEQNYINFKVNKIYDSKEIRLDILTLNAKNLSNESTKSLALPDNCLKELCNLFLIEDMKAFSNYAEFGINSYEYLIGILGSEKDSIDNLYNKLGEYIYEMLEDDKIRKFINPDRFYQIALFRIIQYLERCKNNIENYETTENDLILITNIMVYLSQKVKKIDERNVQKIPVFDFEEKNKPILFMITPKELIENEYEVYNEFVDALIKKDENYIYTILRMKCLNLTKEEVLKYLPVVKEPENFLYTIFSKTKSLNEKDFINIINEHAELDINKIIPKLLLNKKIKIDEFIEKKIISGKNIRELYDNGTIDISLVNKISNGYPNLLDKSSLDFSSIKLAQLYKELYKDDIIKIFKNKEKYDEQSIAKLEQENFKKENKGNNEQSEKLVEIEKIKKEFRFQKEMFLTNATEKDIKEFIEALGEDLGLSSNITLDLLKKGIISEEQALEIDSIGDIKNYIDSKNNKKYSSSMHSKETYKNQNKLLNLIAHKQILPKDIIKLYAQGLISPELYKELEGDNFKGQVDKKYLTELAEKLKYAGKQTNYDEIEKYVTECKKYATDIDFFKNYDEKLLASKKIDKLQLVELGKRGLLSKSAISSILERGDYEVIFRLIKGENSLDLDTAKELFQDEYCGAETSHHKRDLLEKVLSKGNFSNDELFSILLATYRGNEQLSDSQIELNSDNLQYFFDKGFVKIELDDGKIDKSYKSHKTKNGGTSFGGGQDDQQRFPLFSRFDNLFTLDKNTIFNKKGPALVFNAKSLNKTIIETLGTIKDDILINDLTNHRTFIMDTDIYEKYKDEFIVEINSKEVVQYNKLIDWFDREKDILDMKECRHTKNWSKNVRRTVGLSEKNKKFNINKDVVEAFRNEVI